VQPTSMRRSQAARRTEVESSIASYKSPFSKDMANETMQYE